MGSRNQMGKEGAMKIENFLFILKIRGLRREGMSNEAKRIRFIRKKQRESGPIVYFGNN